MRRLVILIDFNRHTFIIITIVIIITVTYRAPLPERLTGVITTRRYTNPRLPLPYLYLTAA